MRSGYPEEDSALKIGLDEEYQKRPIAVVNPVLSLREKTERAEVSGDKNESRYPQHRSTDAGIDFVPDRALH